MGKWASKEGKRAGEFENGLVKGRFGPVKGENGLMKGNSLVNCGASSGI